MSPPPVYGLVLAGGESSRMRRDKAALGYDGATQLERVFALLSRHVSPVFGSARAAQADEPIRAGKPLILDAATLGGLDLESHAGGPMVGIRSAFARFPQIAISHQRRRRVRVSSKKCRTQPSPAHCRTGAPGVARSRATSRAIGASTAAGSSRMERCSR